MSNENIIIDIRITSHYPLHVSNKTELIINSNVNNQSNEQAHLILVLNPVLSNEGSGEPVKMCS